MEEAVLYRCKFIQALRTSLILQQISYCRQLQLFYPKPQAGTHCWLLELLQNVSPSSFVLQDNGLIYSKPLNEVVEVKVQKHNKSQTAIQHFHFLVKPREIKTNHFDE